MSQCRRKPWGQDAKWIAILGMILHGSIAPQVFGKLPPQTDDRTIVETQSALLALFGGYFTPAGHT